MTVSSGVEGAEVSLLQDTVSAEAGAGVRVWWGRTCMDTEVKPYKSNRHRQPPAKLWLLPTTS